MDHEYEQFCIDGNRSSQSFEMLFRVNEGNYVKVYTKSPNNQSFKGYILSTDDDAVLLFSDETGICSIAYQDIFYALFKTLVIPIDDNGKWE